MWRLPLIILLTHHIGTAHVTQDAAFASRLSRLLQKLEKLNVSMTSTEGSTPSHLDEKLYSKLDKLNAIRPKKAEYVLDSVSSATSTERGVKTIKSTFAESPLVVETTPSPVTKTTEIPTTVAPTTMLPTTLMPTTLTQTTTILMTKKQTTKKQTTKALTTKTQTTIAPATMAQTTNARFRLPIPVEVSSKKPSASMSGVGNIPPPMLSERLLPPADRVLTEEDDEMLSAMQIMGNMSADQMENMATELLRCKGQKGPNGDFSDDEWVDDLNDLGDGEYPNDDWDTEYMDSPTAMTKPEPGDDMPVDPVLATLERPRIIYERPSYISHFLSSALAHIKSVILNGKCHTPQPRWLTVRQLAPAADTVYMPSQVLLHRCTPDSGCCLDQTQHCAPINGEYVTLPFYLNKATGNNVARIVFYNHTECGCISNSTRPTPKPPTEPPYKELISAKEIPSSRSSESFEFSSERITSRADTETSLDYLNHAEEYRLSSVSVPELKRCTCPTLFQAKTTDGSCSCTCDWPDHSRRRNCLSLSRGREHFGLRDRVCIGNGDCTVPSCDYGAYDKSSGQCPVRKFRRVRYSHRSRGR